MYEEVDKLATEDKKIKDIQSLLNYFNNFQKIMFFFVID